MSIPNERSKSGSHDGASLDWHRIIIVATHFIAWFCTSAAADAVNVHASVALSHGSPAAPSWCAAGATAEGLTLWWDSHSAGIAAHGESLPALCAMVGASGNNFTDATAEVLRSGSTSTRQAAVAATRAAFDAAVQAHQHARAAIRGLIDDAIQAQFGSEGLALARRMEANSHRPVPDNFKCMELTEVDWQVLQVALRKTEQQLPLSATETEALRSAHADALVQTVADRIETNGLMIQEWTIQHAHTAAASASGPLQ